VNNKQVHYSLYRIIDMKRSLYKAFSVVLKGSIRKNDALASVYVCMRKKEKKKKKTKKTIFTLSISHSHRLMLFLSLSLFIDDVPMPSLSLSSTHF
jgi:hypothetical protein